MYIIRIAKPRKSSFSRSKSLIQKSSFFWDPNVQDPLEIGLATPRLSNLGCGLQVGGSSTSSRVQPVANYEESRDANIQVHTFGMTTRTISVIDHRFMTYRYVINT